MGQMQRIGKTATTVATTDGITSVTYHRTAVVKFSDGAVRLNSDGWATATTKARMNQTANQFGLGFSVFQKSHVWYVVLPDGETVEYFDGITFKRSRTDSSLTDLGSEILLPLE